MADLLPVYLYTSGSRFKVVVEPTFYQRTELTLFFDFLWINSTSYDFIAISFLGLLAKTQRRQWHPTPVLLPGKPHGRRSLVGCSPWGLEELDTTERLHFHFLLSCFGEGNGNPLQCSCLENPRDGGAWWAAICGVAQSQTRLK